MSPSEGKLKRQFEKRLAFTAVLCDIVIITLADLISFLLRFKGQLPVRNIDAYLQIVGWIILLRILFLYVFGLYEYPKFKTSFDVITSTFKATTLSSMIIIIAAFYFRAFAYPRTIILISWMITTFMIIFWRAATRFLIKNIFMPDFFLRKLLIIGTGDVAHKLAIHAVRSAKVDYKLLGFLQISEDEYSPEIQRNEILGKTDQLHEILSGKIVDEVIVASSSISREMIMEIFSMVADREISFNLVPDLYETLIGQVITDEISDLPLVKITSQKTNWYIRVKRLFDLSFSILFLVLGSPVYLAVAICIKLSSSGPVIYTQFRTGLNGKPFRMYKFRTMIQDAEADQNPVWAKKEDERTIFFGRFLRKSRLDELPQFYNVLKNDMSIIGPRPERPFFVKDFVDNIPFYAERIQMKPGITGWAQVAYQYAASEDESKEKLLHDIYYIENASFFLDLYILLKTIKVVLTGKGAY